MKVEGFSKLEIEGGVDQYGRPVEVGVKMLI